MLLPGTSGPFRSRSFRLLGAACLLAVGAFQPAAGQQQDGGRIPVWLRLEGDPAGDLELAKGWRPESPTTIPGDRGPLVREGPLWCDAVARRGGYSPDAALPPPPERLVGHDPADVMRWLGLHLKQRPAVVATEHAVLVIALPPCPSAVLDDAEKALLKEYYPHLGRSLSVEQRAVLYGLRFLEFQARWRDLLGLLPGTPWEIAPQPEDHLGAKGRMQVFLFNTQKAYREFGRHFFRGFGVAVSFWFDARADSVVLMVDGEDLPDAHLQARMEFGLNQALLMQYKGFRHHIPAWVGCGMSHFFERLHEQAPDTFPTTGAPLGRPQRKPWKLGWEHEIRLAVAKNLHTPFDEIGKVKYEGLMSQLEHAQCWSMVRFFLGLARERWRHCVDSLKVRKSEDETLENMHRRALLKAYEADLPTLETAWKDWVLRTYR